MNSFPSYLSVPADQGGRMVYSWRVLRKVVSGYHVFVSPWVMCPEFGTWIGMMNWLDLT
jgi:hypothetical protein